MMHVTNFWLNFLFKDNIQTNEWENAMQLDEHWATCFIAELIQNKHIQLYSNGMPINWLLVSFGVKFQLALKKKDFEACRIIYKETQAYLKPKY